MYHKELFEILNLLNEKEKAELELILFSKKKKDTFTNNFIKFLSDQKEIPGTEDIYRKVFKNKQPLSDSSFKKLVSRATTEVLNNINIMLINNTPEDLDEKEVIKLKILQKLSALEFLMAKGSRIKTTEVLRDEIIKLATEIRFYPVLIFQLNVKKYMLAFRLGNQGLQEIEEKIKYYEACAKADKISLDLSYKIKLEFWSVTNDIIYQKEVLNKHILILTKELESTNSPIVMYFLLYHKLWLSYAEENYENATELCMEIHKLIKENLILRNKNAYGIIYDNIAKCHIHLKNYSQAIALIKKSRELFGKGTRNYCLTLEHEFLCCFYNNQVNFAEDLLKQLLLHLKRENGPVEFDILKFYQGVIKLKKGEFAKALKIMDNKYEFSKDKAGWNLWTRIIKILLLIYTGQEDKATLAIENLNKQAQRTLKTLFIRERDKVILKILNELSKNGFSDRYFAKTSSLLIELNTKECAWEPFTAELIPFEEMLHIHFKKLNLKGAKTQSRFISIGKAENGNKLLNVK